ncbi:exosortase-dependent surface protein XDP1 [Paraglaciecola aquimarina]|uniref:Exosortase-dependent surface protein XDP1 n=1 Tax=Paraglaciecola aquimarina TaxID=1235557 RepID=A0ABU3SWZ9_9ALTE|nr:exosortase-dependent surface protein XDP1 [Paraglaciecola aquimarina]MDU0354534.1 exosortase-dependent surface protein XDP1 [Paraglaciecola aquimarina]
MKSYGINKVLFLGLLCGIFSNVSVASCGHSSSGSSSSTATCDTWAGAEIYDMYIEGTGKNIDQGTNASSGTVVVDGVTIKVSAWSDTLGNNDDIVEEASIAGPWRSGSETGYGIINTDEASFDNHSSAHAIDNKGSWADYDMILFSFSEEVSLSGATFSWLGGSASTQQVSAVGLNDISDLTSERSTWSNIANSAVDSGSFQIEEYNDVYVSDFTTTKAAQYWLVGAYNSVFGYVSNFSENNDAFKLATIGFSKQVSPVTPPTGVNGPSSLALLLLSGGLVAWRQRKSK